MLDVRKYRQKSNRSQFRESTRSEKRGFTRFIADMLYASQQQQPIKSLCEIGVSWGRKQRMWCEVTTDDCEIVGVDLYEPDRPEHYELRHEITHIGALIDAKKKAVMYSKLTLLLGEDGYIPETVDRALSAISTEKFDIVIDDGATSWPDMRDSLPSWSRAISDTGCYITETPDGNGDSMKDVSMMHHQIRFAELVVQGMVIFDLFKFKDINENDHYGNFVGIWAPNLDLYTTVIKKYEEYIVAGKSNIDYLLH